MKIVTKTILVVDRDKPQFPANTEVDLPKKVAEELLERGLVNLPTGKPKAARKAAKPASGADSGNDSLDEDPGDDEGEDSQDQDPGDDSTDDAAGGNQ